MQVTLLVRAPRKPEKRVTVESDVVIGRAKDCNLQVLSNDVSRKHCQLVIGESSVAIRDLGSGNGTLLNGQKTEPNKDTPLISGDIVRIGPLVIRVDFHANPLLTSESPTAASPAEDPASEQILEPVSVDPTPAASAPPAEPTEVDSTPEPVLEPMEEGGLMPDDEAVSEEFAEVDPDDMEVLEPIDEEPAETEPAKKKSLFGMFGREKDKSTTATEPPAVAAEAESAPEPLLVSENADLDEETVVVAQENAFTADESDLEPLSDDDLIDEDDYEVEDEAVDPGFADFLNNVDQPPR